MRDDGADPLADLSVTCSTVRAGLLQSLAVTGVYSS